MSEKNSMEEQLRRRSIAVLTNHCYTNDPEIVHKSVEMRKKLEFGPHSVNESSIDPKVLKFIESMDKYQLKRNRIRSSELCNRQIELEASKVIPLINAIQSSFTHKIAEQFKQFPEFAISTTETCCSLFNAHFERSSPLFSACLSEWIDVFTLPPLHNESHDNPSITVIEGVAFTYRLTFTLDAPLVLYDPRILMLDTSIEFMQSPYTSKSHRSSVQFVSLSTLSLERSQFFLSILMKIQQLKPDLILVSGFICGEMETLLLQNDIYFLSNIPLDAFTRISYLLNSSIYSMSDLIRNVGPFSMLKDTLGSTALFSITPQSLDKKISNATALVTLRYSKPSHRPHYTLLVHSQSIPKQSIVNLVTNCFDLVCEKALLKDMQAVWIKAEYSASLFEWISEDHNVVSAWSRRHSSLPCHLPEISHNLMYGKNDLSLGGFLFLHFFGPSAVHNCIECQKPVGIDHDLVISNQAVQVTFEMHSFPSNILSEGSVHSVLTWERCRKCGCKVTAVQSLSKAAFSMSFLSFMQMIASEKVQDVSQDPSGCSHSVFRDHTWFFGYKDQVVSCSFQRRKSLDLVVRRNGFVLADSYNLYMKAFVGETHKALNNVFLLFSNHFKLLQNIITKEETDHLKLAEAQQQIAIEKQLRKKWDAQKSFIEIAWMFKETTDLCLDHHRILSDIIRDTKSHRLPSKYSESSIPPIDRARTLSMDLRRANSAHDCSPSLFTDKLLTELNEFFPQVQKTHKLFRAQWTFDQPCFTCTPVPVLLDCPSTMISHALSSQQYFDFLKAKMDQNRTKRETLRTASEKFVYHIKDLKGAVVKVIAYYSVQFHVIRDVICGSHSKFTNAIWDSSGWFADGGKSGSTFFKSSDGAFILKEISVKEFKMFQGIAQPYFEFLSASLIDKVPSTVLPMLGTFKLVQNPNQYQDSITSITQTQPKTRCFVIMPNLSYYQDFDHLFDLKGIFSRAPSEKGSSENRRVLFDRNFIQYSKGLPVPLNDCSRFWLQKAIQNDCDFMCSQSIMDYSLLVGITEDESGKKGQLFVGMIDYLHQFNLEKQLETRFKSIFAKDPTILHPKKYKERFLSAMKAYFLF